GKLASAMGPDDRATLLRAGASVTTLCAACRQADLERALANARVGAGQADFDAALGVAAGLAGRSGEGRVDTVIISDGAFDTPPTSTLPSSIRYIQVGGAIDNRAITVLSARRPPDGSPGYSAYARVENFGSRDA